MNANNFSFTNRLNGNLRIRVTRALYNFRQRLGRPARFIFFHLVMRFDNLRIEIAAEQFGSFTRQPKKHIYSDAEIRREHNRQRLRGLFNHFSLLFGMTSCADDKRFTVTQRNATDFINCVNVTEIDHDIAIFHRRFDGIPQITLRDDLDIRIALGKIDNRFSHSAGRTDQEHSQRCLHRAPSKVSSVLRRRAWLAAVISHNGNRHSPVIAPRQPSAVFTGTGFGSMNKSLKSGNNFRCNFSADFTSPDSKIRTRLQTSAGNKFDATLTTPTAPTDMNGSVNESSPLRIVNDSGKHTRNSLMRSTLPLASFMETIFLHSFARRVTVSGAISTPQRPGIL